MSISMKQINKPISKAAQARAIRALFLAIREGDPSEVSVALADGASFNSVRYGTTAVKFACGKPMRGHWVKVQMDIILMLVKSGAKLDTKQQYDIVVNLIHDGNFQGLQTSIKAGWKLPTDIRSRVVRANCPEIWKIFVSSDQFRANERDSGETYIEQVLDRGPSWRCEERDHKNAGGCIKELLNAGCYIEALVNGNTPLITAISNGMPDAVEVLVNHGANISVCDGCERTLDAVIDAVEDKSSRSKIRAIIERKRLSLGTGSARGSNAPSRL
jgi:hypothetical protein